ncbi:MAG: hypothetical protein KF788_18445 [Piscinibacter sp.]|nr:hypothetical protein [Piscinibacter sp.]
MKNLPRFVTLAVAVLAAATLAGCGTWHRHEAAHGSPPTLAMADGHGHGMGMGGMHMEHHDGTDSPHGACGAMMGAAPAASQ